jgi:signal transduction histidine kinase
MKQRVFTRFALLALGCVVTLALVMGFALSSLLTRAVSAWEWQNTAALVQREVQLNGLWDVFASPPAGPRADRGPELSRLLTSLPEVVRVKVWDPTTAVIWSDTPALVGRRFPDNRELQQALGGEVAVAIKPLVKREHASERDSHAVLAEVYVPVVDERGRVVGVIEVYKVPERLLATIKQGRFVVWAISLAGGLILYLVVLPLLTQVYRRQIEERTLRAHAARLEAEVEERTAQLLQAQKMQAVGLLAGGIAHDFNNLLTVISSRGELLRDRLAADDPRRVSAESILRTAEQATRLTRQLLAFARKQPYEPVALDLNTLVADAQHVLGRLLPAGIELRLGLDPSLGRVTADPGQMEQVLLNLVVNARDAMPGGGRLTITTGNVDIDAPAAGRAGSPPAGRYVMVAVGDTGVGMDAATQARIFEPFFTTKAPGRGTGLGLSTVYGIVERHGGHITLESAPGIGTTFRIHLPRVAVDAAGPAPTEAAIGVGATDATILVVEDEEGVRGVTVEILRRAGHTVIEAPDGATALWRAAQHRGPIHLLVTDVVMPDINGWELGRRLTALRPETRVLFVTGYAALEGLEIEAIGPVLHKPFTPATLTSRVQDLLRTAVSTP